MRPKTSGRWQDPASFEPPDTAPAAPAPAPAPAPTADSAPTAYPPRGVTMAHGRYYRNEGLEPTVKNTITAEDRKLMAQRSREAAEFNKQLEDLELAAAIRLGEALRTLDDPD